MPTEQPKGLSLETRASAAYVQGELQELIKDHARCFDDGRCTLLVDLQHVLGEWQQVEAQLKAHSLGEAP